MHEFEYSFIRAKTEVAKLQPDRNVSQIHRNELARYQEYLNLEPDKFVVPTDDLDTSSYVDSIPAANHQNKKENIKNSALYEEVSEDDEDFDSISDEDDDDWSDED